MASGQASPPIDEESKEQEGHRSGAAFEGGDPVGQARANPTGQHGGCGEQRESGQEDRGKRVGEECRRPISPQQIEAGVA